MSDGSMSEFEALMGGDLGDLDGDAGEIDDAELERLLGSP